MIIGVDEVGRGCLAGPVCVGAVVMCDAIEGVVDDSKRLTAAQRQVIAQLVKEHTAVGLGWASPAYIDQHGLTASLRHAAIQAIAQISHEFRTYPFGHKTVVSSEREARVSEDAETILLDGNSNYIGCPQVRTVVGGDGVEPAIAAASVVAKVARDSYMQAVGVARYQGYGFEAHVGYGTAAHRAVLAELGPCDIHRMSFGVLREYTGVN